MTEDTILAICRRYEIKMTETSHPNKDKIFDMCREIPVFYTEGRVEKAMRWLGFVQGLLFSARTYTLDELKDHNRGRP